MVARFSFLHFPVQTTWPTEPAAQINEDEDALAAETIQARSSGTAWRSGSRQTQEKSEARTAQALWL